jgi:3-oxoacyl-(acyl-carrier-protein) synthase
VETIACLLAMQHEFLPGTPRLSSPAEGVPASVVASPRPATRIKHVLKLNTGFGGINAAVVLGHG